MTDKEKQYLYEAIQNDINCGTFILAPQYVDKLINKYTKKSNNCLKRIAKIIQKCIS